MKVLKAKLVIIATAITRSRRGITRSGTKYKESKSVATETITIATATITKVITARAHKPGFFIIVNRALRKLTIGPFLSPSKRAFTRRAKKTN